MSCGREYIHFATLPRTSILYAFSRTGRERSTVVVFGFILMNGSIALSIKRSPWTVLSAGNDTLQQAARILEHHSKEKSRSESRYLEILPCRRIAEVFLREGNSRSGISQGPDIEK